MLNTFKASGNIESFTTKSKQTLRYKTVKKQVKGETNARQKKTHLSSRSFQFLGGELKNTADETLFLELALRGYDLSKLRDEKTTAEIIKLAQRIHSDNRKGAVFTPRLPLFRKRSSLHLRPSFLNHLKLRTGTPILQVVGGKSASLERTRMPKNIFDIPSILWSNQSITLADIVRLTTW